MTKWAMGDARKDSLAFAPCGQGLVHEPHLFRSKKGKVMTCDGYPRNPKTGETYRH